MAAWLEAYALLASALERNLERSGAILGGVTDAGRRRLHQEEMTLVRAELDRTRGRLAHWRQAAGPAELTAR